MIIDVVFALAVILGFYHGYKNGIFYSLISLFGIFIACLAAMKLAFWVSINLEGWLNIPAVLLPFVSMILVFVLVLLGLRVVSHLLEKALSAIALTQVNKLSGGALWTFIALFIISVFLWLLDKGQIIRPELKSSSFSYPIIHPVAPYVFDLISYLSPLFKECYEQLGKLFEEFSKKT